MTTYVNGIPATVTGQNLQDFDACSEGFERFCKHNGFTELFERYDESAVHISALIGAERIRAANEQASREIPILSLFDGVVDLSDLIWLVDQYLFLGDDNETFNRQVLAGTLKIGRAYAQRCAKALDPWDLEDMLEFFDNCPIEEFGDDDQRKAKQIHGKVVVVTKGSSIFPSPLSNALQNLRAILWTLYCFEDGLFFDIGDGELDLHNDPELKTEVVNAVKGMFALEEKTVKLSEVVTVTENVCGSVPVTIVVDSSKFCETAAFNSDYIRESVERDMLQNGHCKD